MKSTDLRVGNIINSFDPDKGLYDVVEVASIDNNGNMHYNTLCNIGNKSTDQMGYQTAGCPINGVSLNEEYLKSKSFEKVVNKTAEGEVGYELRNEEPSKHIYIRTGTANPSGFFTLFNHSECSSSEIQFIKRLNYVHELQNAYHFITGFEL